MIAITWVRVRVRVRATPLFFRRQGASALMSNNSYSSTTSGGSGGAGEGVTETRDQCKWCREADFPCLEVLIRLKMSYFLYFLGVVLFVSDQKRRTRGMFLCYNNNITMHHFPGNR